MDIPFIKQLLSYIHDIQDQPSLYRRYLLTLVLQVIALLTFSLFIFINASLNIFILVYFDIFATIVTLLSLYQLVVKKNLTLAASISTLLIFLFLVFFSYVTKGQNFGLAWTFCFPLFAIPLLGKKKGLSIIILFYLILIPMAYSGIKQWDNGLWDWVSFIRYVLITIIIIFIAYFYESTSQKALKIINLSREKEREYLSILENQSQKDQLTKLYNRRYFDDQFSSEYDKVERYHSTFCLIMIDIDHFKQINDQHGHPVGDKILKQFSEVLLDKTRNSDIVSRWGGEEFMLLLPNTEIASAQNIAEKLRKTTFEYSFTHNIRLSISAGVIEIANNNLNKREFMYKIDEALYQAKSSGRNKVVLQSLS